MAGELPPDDSGNETPAAGAKRAAVRVFQCPACGATLEIKAIGQTVTVGCRACGATLDTTREEVALVAKGKLLKRQIHIPIGSRGRFDGALYEVIGIMGRYDQASRYGWKEYLLYNPYQGFRWLSEAGGHWSFVSPMKTAPKVESAAFGKPTAREGARDYVHFQTSEAVVDFVLGEFYWSVKAGDRSRLADYVDPPELLSCETNGSERIWSRCLYLDPNALAIAFGMKSPPPPPVGVAPNQPNGRLVTWRAVRGTYFAFSAIILVLFVFHRWQSPREQLILDHRQYNPSAVEKSAKLGPFMMNKAGNLEIALDARIQNAYIDVDVDLVNETTGESRDMQLGSEYWSGYDSDGSWSEGSQTSSDLESGVGPGIYHLVVSPTTGDGSGRPVPVEYRLTATRGVPVGSNLFLAWIVLSLFPLLTFFRASAFESERWSGSDYASSGGDDDDE